MKQMSVINTESIRRHPTNNSSSKNAIHFSKQQRFQNWPSPCSQAFYSKPETISTRKAGFGYGNKSDFTKTFVALNPGSGHYETISDFDRTASKKNGKSFGNSREQKSNKSYLIPQLKRVPGPGQYQITDSNMLSKSKICYSTRARTIDVIDKNLTFKFSPGPGSYENLTMLPQNGKHTVSKYKDVQFAKIDPSSPRFEKLKSMTPGPLTYKQIDSLDGLGKYHITKFKSPKKTVFSQSKRSSFTDEQSKKSISPGPCNYDSPSQFGKYGDSKYYKTLKSFYNPQR